MKYLMMVLALTVMVPSPARADSWQEMCGIQMKMNDYSHAAVSCGEAARLLLRAAASDEYTNESQAFAEGKLAAVDAYASAQAYHRSGDNRRAFILLEAAIKTAVHVQQSAYDSPAVEGFLEICYKTWANWEHGYN